MKLSVIIPAYNEYKTIGAILQHVVRALPKVEKEIIIIDDSSTDGTIQWLKENLAEADGVYSRLTINKSGGLKLTSAGESATKRFSFKVLFHSENKGKGGALRTGFAAATGDVVIVQDADLEYDPQDWEIMWSLIDERKVADVVYGSRFFGRPHRSLYYHHYLGNRLISLLFNLLYDQTLSDVEVCYKMFTREVLDTLSLTSDDFGIEIEMSAQIAKPKRWRIYEVGISYFGRTYAEGKKINWKDGVKALWYLFRFRF